MTIKYAHDRKIDLFLQGRERADKEEKIMKSVQLMKLLSIKRNKFIVKFYFYFFNHIIVSERYSHYMRVCGILIVKTE